MPRITCWERETEVGQLVPGLGWDFAGTVVATGPGVDLAVGTRVAGLVAGFDRDFGTYAEQLVVPAADLAVVPDGLDLVAASTVPLNGLAAAQIVDLLGDAPTDGNRLLVTGAAGAVGGYVASLAQDRGWQVTGLARAEDEEFVRGLGAEFTVDAEPGWDAVADGAVLRQRGLALVRDGGAFVGVRPGAEPASERGITVTVVVAHLDSPRLGGLLARLDPYHRRFRRRLRCGPSGREPRGPRPHPPRPGRRRRHAPQRQGRPSHGRRRRPGNPRRLETSSASGSGTTPSRRITLTRWAGRRSRPQPPRGCTLMVVFRAGTVSSRSSVSGR
ncbi:alcohol dehydrogenase catalytic domain-containing protein [Nonomuraea sp. SYSU D8015]|uniref:alcohol dehydrogenase catalytic domain-containing protein n=1 Tax=Nonomuraea sp. SYSU D8015 TaxID=2593644 RepID=UPI001CB7453E|nr:hypothetical protein [Nonomuraea sp. SYSU D8015]